MSVFVDNLEVADLDLESNGERGSHTLYAHRTKTVPRLREMNASATAPVSADALVPGPNNLSRRLLPHRVRGNQIGSFHFIFCGLTFIVVGLDVRLTTLTVLESDSLSDRTGCLTCPATTMTSRSAASVGASTCCFLDKAGPDGHQG